MAQRNPLSTLAVVYTPFIGLPKKASLASGFFTVLPFQPKPSFMHPPLPTHKLG